MPYPPRVRLASRLTLAALAILAAAAPAWGQGFDSTKTPATAVPAARWGQLEPRAILGDTSWWNFGSTPTDLHPFFHDLDVENGWLFASTGRGLMVWDLRTDPANPTRTAYAFAGPKDRKPSPVPDWHQNDTKFYLFGVDAPAGVDSVVGMACISGNGFLIWDTRDKANPRLLYQDDSKEGTQVYAATLGGRHYGFYAATSDRVLVYDLSAALQLPGPAACMDASPASTPCTGGGAKVYVGKLATASGASYVAGVGTYLAVAAGSGVEIWQVADPRAATRVFTVSGVGFVKGVAMWQQGSSYYLAAVDIAGKALKIYDLSCLAGGSCASAPQIGSFPLTTTNGSDYLYVTFSRRGTTPFLYVGGDNQFGGGAQREFLLDVSNPASPTDITPKADASGYWGWYYYGNPTGFNWVMPRFGKFYGDHLYRAAFSVIDVHAYAGALPPAAGFGWNPAEVYPGTPVTFIDQSTGNVTSWSWTFQDGTPATSSLESPGTVTFATEGNK
ncbi:MAG TPA: PKD domain-containing protein, partial [Thermoanaerobaculia bacterium]|nr:PKD domain-containing protein [Thermoanaerobaculia bacterium]